MGEINFRSKKCSISGVFFDLGQIAVFWFHPLWLLGIDGVFSRFWADGCFLALSAMVSGISNCDRDFCDFGGVGSFSGLRPIVYGRRWVFPEI